MVTQKKIRLNKYIAQSGLASRRKADELIVGGSVKVNGHIITEMGSLVDPTSDSVKVGRKLIKPATELLYFMLNKPASVLSTVSDPEGRKTVMDYCEEITERVFPIGRLDWDSEGLLLLTNDGDFSQAVAHPKERIAKTYLVKISGKITDQKLEKLRNGITIPGGRVKALVAERTPHKQTKYDWIKLIIEEGKNRQIRYMMEKVDCDVIKLQRVAIGMLTLGKLKKGQLRQLSETEVDKIFYKFKKKKIEELSTKNKQIKKKAKTGTQNKKKAPSKSLSKKEFFKRVKKGKA